jgi:hypothetical protein
MDGSSRADHILALGRKLVEEFGSEPSVDTLGRWMAHHVAELVISAENATGEEKGLADKKCFEAILTLWKHRAELPNGKRPLEELEPVIRAVESLDPESDTPRYFRSARPPEGEVREQSEAETWLAMVDGIEYSAKVLIGYCLAEAARAAVDKSKEWIKLAEAAEADTSSSEIVIRFVASNADLGKEPDANAEVRQRLQDRMGRIEGFIKLAESFARDMKARLEALPPLEEGNDSAAEKPFEPEPNDCGDAK